MGARGFFFSLEATELSGEAAKASREVTRKKYYVLTKWPAPRWLDSSVGSALHRYYSGQNIAPIKVQFSRAFLKFYMVCDMPLRDVQTIHVSNMLARDSVILLVTATKMVKTDSFTSSLVHFRRTEPNKSFILSRIAMFLQEPSRCCSDRFISFGKHCWTEDKKTIILNGK